MMREGRSHKDYDGIIEMLDSNQMVSHPDDILHPKKSYLFCNWNRLYNHIFLNNYLFSTIRLKDRILVSGTVWDSVILHGEIYFR